MNKNTIKPEMTVEAKARFFALYFNQIVLFNPDIDPLMVLNATTLGDYHNGDCLQLKPISSITDEDAKWVAAKMRWNGIKSVAQTIVLLNLSMFPAEVIDYLRSKGYAVDWMGYKIEQMIEAGWIKISEKGGFDA